MTGWNAAASANPKAARRKVRAGGLSSLQRRKARAATSDQTISAATGA